MRKAIIVGASSGIGREVALLLLADGWHCTLSARRQDALEELRRLYPSQVGVMPADVTAADAPVRLQQTLEQMGGVDLYFHASGVGRQNSQLLPDVEEQTLQTNALGFMRMVGVAFRFMAAHGGGQIAVISSIAGTRGLGAAPSYSATKAFCNAYIESLEQLSHMRGLNISFTDIRPGFVRTALLDDGRNYPLMMRPERVARHIVRAVGRRRSVAVIDWRYRVLVFFWRLIPRWLWVRLPVRN